MNLRKIAVASDEDVAGPARDSSYILPSLTINRRRGAFPTADYNSWKGFKVLAKGIELKSTTRVTVQLHACETDIIFHQIQSYILSRRKVGLDCLWAVYEDKPVLAQRRADGNWYRAIVLEKEHGKVTAMLIDTGETVKCTNKQVMMCPPQFKHCVPGVVKGRITGFNGRESPAEVRALKELFCGKDITVVIKAAGLTGLIFSIYDLNMAPLCLLLEKKMLSNYPFCEPPPFPIQKCSRCGYEELLVEDTRLLSSLPNDPVSAVGILDMISWQLSGPKKDELQNLLTIFLAEIANVYVVDKAKLKQLLNAWTFSKTMPTSPLYVTDALQDEFGFTGYRSVLYLPQHITGQEFFDVLNKEIAAGNK